MVPQPAANLSSDNLPSASHPPTADPPPATGADPCNSKAARRTILPYFRLERHPARSGLSAYACQQVSTSAFQLVSNSAFWLGVAERFYEGREHLFDFLRLVFGEFLMLVGVQVAEFVGEE